MNIVKKSLQALGLILLPWHFAHAIDPVKWAQTQAFPDQVLVDGGTYVASYTFTSQIPLTMVRPFMVMKTSNSPAEFRYDDACSGKKLAYLESCTVKIYLDPTSAGQKTVQLTQQYGNDQVPLPQLLSRAVGNGPAGAVTGAVTTPLPATMNIGDSAADWVFTYTNNGDAPATGVVLSVSGSTYNTNCGSSLSNVAPGNTCHVQGQYSPNSAGVKSISALFSYTQGNPVQLSTSTLVSGASGGLVCTAAVPLAPEVKVNTESPVTLLCTNQSGAPLNLNSRTISLVANPSGALGTFNTLGGGDDNCGSGTLPNGAACQLKGKYTAPASVVNNNTLTLVVNYGSNQDAQTSTSTQVVTTISNTRDITIVNKCNFTVWWSMVGGAITNSPACASSADCPTGSTCNVSAATCYYNNYGPTAGAYQLAPNGGDAKTQIIETPASNRAGDNVLWKGLISGSTQCSGSSCANNDCQSNGGTTSCAPGVGFQQPATEAEFTFLLLGSGNVDTYDITNVNGFSMPMSMETQIGAGSYWCGTPGSYTASGSFGACNFSGITPPTQMYYWVNLTNTACTAQNTCTDNTKICGLAFSPSTNGFVKNCGSFLGYWAANQICQTQPNFSSPFGDNFSCNQMLSSPFPSNTYTLTQLFKCSPPSSTAPLFNSCYLNYAGYSSTQLQQCCGCTDWNGIANPSQLCPAGQTDPQWTSYVLPTIQWMKQACPTSYAYPFDDKASTFQCTAAAATKYTITFCPGDPTGGLPASKTDGR